MLRKRVASATSLHKNFFVENSVMPIVLQDFFDSFFFLYSSLLFLYFRFAVAEPLCGSSRGLDHRHNFLQHCLKTPYRGYLSSASDRNGDQQERNASEKRAIPALLGRFDGGDGGWWWRLVTTGIAFRGSQRQRQGRLDDERSGLDD